jgi:hypothetical protein
MNAKCSGELSIHLPPNSWSSHVGETAFQSRNFASQPDWLASGIASLLPEMVVKEAVRLRLRI